MQLTHKGIASTTFLISFLIIMLNQFVSIDGKFWDILLIVVMLTVGIAHGCFDIILQNKTETVSKRRLHFLYNFKIVLYGLVWYYLPNLAFIFFLFISAWHFGETDLMVLKVKINPLNNILYGLGIIGWILAGNISNFMHVMKNIGLLSKVYHHSLDTPSIIIIQCCLSLCAILTVFIINNVSFTKAIVLISLLALLRMLPFNQAFLVYFGIWHSFQTLVFIKASLGNVFVSKLKEVVKSLSIFYILLALCVFVVINAVVKLGIQITSVASISVIILMIISTLTLPHLVIMHKMFVKFNIKSIKYAS